MRLSLFAAALLFTSIAAHATSLTYTETVTASGSLNNTAFTNQLVTLSVTGDTSTVTGSNGGIFITPGLTLSGTVGTIGSFSIGGIQVFSNEGFSIGGFTDGSLGDILDTSNSAFSTYNLESVFGPVTGGAESSLQTYNTATGTFRLSSLSSNATFQATPAVAPPAAAATPEPSSFALLCSGLLGVIGVARRRFA